MHVRVLTAWQLRTSCFRVAAMGIRHVVIEKPQRAVRVFECVRLAVDRIRPCAGQHTECLIVTFPRRITPGAVRVELVNETAMWVPRCGGRSMKQRARQSSRTETHERRSSEHVDLSELDERAPIANIFGLSIEPEFLVREIVAIHAPLDPK